MHPGSQGGAEADAWQAMFLLLVWKQGDALGLVCHGNNVLIVHHEASRGVAAQVDVDEEVVVARAEQTCGWQQTERECTTLPCFSGLGLYTYLQIQYNQDSWVVIQYVLQFLRTAILQELHFNFMIYCHFCLFFFNSRQLVES